MQVPRSNVPPGDLLQAVRRAFGSQGTLFRPTASQMVNESQLAMAEAVAETLVQDGVLVVEAGTGVGKTWAYLAPLLLARQRAWISTATQALQEQLILRDIPALSQALGMPVRAAMLKGRSNYVCLHRLSLALNGELPTGSRDPAWASALTRVQAWAKVSRVGDLSELSGLEENSPLRPWISSSHDNCLREICPRLSECHVYRARQAAKDADWVVINHHLFFSDHTNRDEALPALLPSASTVVFDEAHRLVELGETSLGLSLGSQQLLELARELKSLGPLMARGLQPWAHLALVLEQVARQVLQMLPSAGRVRVQVPWAESAPQGVLRKDWQLARRDVLSALDDAAHSLQLVAGAAAPLQALAERVLQWRHDWILLLQDGPDGRQPSYPAVRWLDLWPNGSWRVVQSAADGAQAFQGAMHNAGTVHSWVFASATLGVDDRLSWLTDGLGLRAWPGLRTLQIDSPFDHAAQASLYIPEDLPEPADERHSAALAVRVAHWAALLRGRTLVLTTSLRACALIADGLRQAARNTIAPPVEILAQGEGSKRTLLARFRAAGQAEPGAVMVAAASFWEGVDLPGDTLQLLVIDKLPFPSPGDPLAQSRVQRARAQGLDPFDVVYVQKAAMALKQGAGRLIRSAGDRGVLVIADRRLTTQNYGARLLKALPPMTRLADEVEMRGALVKLVDGR
jgi:ATP-dependent DNA helicase DinG